MNRKGLAVGIILLWIGTSMIPITAQDVAKSLLPISSGNWLYVGGSGPGNYTKIQDAIDNASDGDTVLVFNGTYYGYIIINKSITLIGENKNTTFIIGFLAYTVSIVSDWVNMSGFTIQNGWRSGEGVRIDSCYNRFFNNIIDIPNDDMRLFGDNNTISNNIIASDSIFLSGDGNIISGNTIANTYYGIYFMDSWDNIISNNSFVNSGLFFSDEIVGNNIVTNNMVNGQSLIYVYNKSDLVIDINAGQIILINCNNIIIQNQEIFNTTVGIQILESNACIISSNAIIGNRYGISLHGLNNTINNNTISYNYGAFHLSGENNSICHNIITDNDNGIYMDAGNYNNILNNTITNNNDDSINLVFSNHNNIIHNIIRNNNGTIRLSGDGNVISYNIITNNNDEGINLAFSEYNNIINNTITNNYGHGIYISNCECNNFINNTIVNNSFDGIRLIGDKNIILANIIANNNNGIYVLKHGYNTITSNNITWNKWSGTYLNCSCNNTISDNSIAKNTLGVYFLSSANNSILKNNILNNKQEAFFNKSKKNMWNYNYWNRPRILPKLIFGTIEKNFKEIPWCNIDWRPALRPYDTMF